MSLPPWPLDEATEPPAHQTPELIQVPTEVGTPLELLPGDVLWRAMGQTNPALARSFEGKTPAERRTAGLLTSPTRKRRAPPHGSRNLSTQRLVSTCIRRGGPSLTRVPVSALSRGPARVSSLSIRLSV